ncbi:hypothetical protein ACLOJK_012778 [Asimina triloba]
MESFVRLSSRLTERETETETLVVLIRRQRPSSDAPVVTSDTVQQQARTRHNPDLHHAQNLTPPVRKQRRPQIWPWPELDSHPSSKPTPRRIILPIQSASTGQQPTSTATIPRASRPSRGLADHRRHHVTPQAARRTASS